MVRHFSLFSKVFPQVASHFSFMFYAPNLVSLSAACCAMQLSRKSWQFGRETRHRRALGINLQFAKLKNVVKLNLAAAGNCFSQRAQFSWQAMRCQCRQRGKCNKLHLQFACPECVFVAANLSLWPLQRGYSFLILLKSIVCFLLLKIVH